MERSWVNKFLRALIGLGVAAGLVMASSVAVGQDLPEDDQVKWERQISYLTSLIDAEPSVPLHYMRMAQAYVRLGQEQRVLQYTDAAVSRGGSRQAADILVGDFYSNQGRHAEALRRYMQVLNEAPSQAHVLTHVWLIAQAARHDPTVRLPVGLPELRELLNKRGYYIADGVVRNGGDGSAAPNAKPQIANGNRRLQNSDFTGAIGAYEEAAAIDAWDPSIYRALGVAYARQADTERAVGAYHLYIALADAGSREVPQVRAIIFDYYKRQR